MDYFSILNLNKEPFSNSPDPDYFFHSQQHVECLQKLELSLRLRRGLNVVIGDVGTGKTTLCRQLIRKFSDDGEIETHLILDPHFSNPHEFLLTVAEALTDKAPHEDTDDYQIKERIKQVLFSKGVDKNKVVILIIDEGQKIPVFCLEILREFLNFETNDYKLLQIAIFAQKEFENTLKEHANLADRINLYHSLQPMNFSDTRSMIQYRLNRSSDQPRRLSLFTYPALWAIYRATKGYPRKIVNLCHRSMLTMIIQNKNKANWFLVQSCVKRVFDSEKKRSWQFAFIGLIAVIAGAIYLFNWSPLNEKTSVAKESAFKKTKAVSVVRPVPEDPKSLSQPKNALTPKAIAVAKNQLEPSKAAPESVAVSLLHDDKMKKAHEVPGILGQLKVKRHETLGGLIQQIYGVYRKAYLRSLLNINPHISDPDTINVGDLILFPAIPAHVTTQPLKHWWVKVTGKDNLEDIVAFMRRYPTDAPSVRLIPHWNRSSGLRFSVLINQHFYDEASARNKLKNLPPDIRANGDIISDWGAHTIFYANPY